MPHSHLFVEAVEKLMSSDVSHSDRYETKKRIWDCICFLTGLILFFLLGECVVDSETAKSPEKPEIIVI